MLEEPDSSNRQKFVLSIVKLNGDDTQHRYVVLKSKSHSDSNSNG